jgi:hypothetical protein
LRGPPLGPAMAAQPQRPGGLVPGKLMAGSLVLPGKKQAAAQTGWAHKPVDAVLAAGSTGPLHAQAPQQAPAVVKPAAEQTLECQEDLDSSEAAAAAGRNQASQAQPAGAAAMQLSCKRSAKLQPGVTWTGTTRPPSYKAVSAAGPAAAASSLGPFAAAQAAAYVFNSSNSAAGRGTLAHSYSAPSAFGAAPSVAAGSMQMQLQLQKLRALQQGTVTLAAANPGSAGSADSSSTAGYRAFCTAADQQQSHSYAAVAAGMPAAAAAGTATAAAANGG